MGQLYGEGEGQDCNAKKQAACNGGPEVQAEGCCRPGAIRTHMRAQAMPGEDPLTLETPDKPAQQLLELCLPHMRENGRLYSYPQSRFLDFQPPS